MEELEKKVLEYLCKSEVDVMNKGFPMPSKSLSRLLNLSLYKTRKALKLLKDKGLVVFVYDSDYDDMSERRYSIWGYLLTELGKQTDEYRQAEEREYQLIDEMLNEEIKHNLGE